MTQVSTTPKRANASPISAAESSSRTAGTSGALARRMKRMIRRPGLPSPPAWCDSLIAVRNENPSSTAAMASTTSATTGEVIFSG